MGLLGLLLVMGIVGCGETVNQGDLRWRDGRWYEGDSEAPFTGVAVKKIDGQKAWQSTYKDGKAEGLVTLWHDNGQKESEGTWKDGKQEGLWTAWHENGQKEWEGTYKDGKPEGLLTRWRKNGQKLSETTYKNGKKVSETKWDKEGNEIKK